MLGISVDSEPSLTEFSKSLGNLPYPLLADFHPKGGMAKLYDVWNEDSGTAFRAAFVIDADGVVRYAQVYPRGVFPTPDEILEQLAKLPEGDSRD